MSRTVTTTEVEKLYTKFPLKVHQELQTHRGIGVSVTKWGIFVSVLAHLSPYLPNLIVVYGAYLGGYWNWLTFGAAWVGVPILDLLIGADTYNLTVDEEEKWRESIWFRVVTWLHTPIQIGLITWVLNWVTTYQLSWIEWTGLLLSVGTVQGSGIGCVHELIHRPQFIDFNLGVISLIWSNYAHFWVAHIWGHHRNVATRKDPASSAKGDNVWTFLPRCITLSFVEAWGIEATWQRKKGHWAYGPFNRIIQAYIVTWAVAYGYYYLFGIHALPFFFLQGFIAVAIVENTNFIEHYGLRRDEISEDRFERVGWFHSWDTPNLLTNSLLFKIQRHPDHHMNASRPYQILRTYPQAPMLPTGYAGMIVLSWFPFLHQWVMDWRVDAVNEQIKEWKTHGTVLGHKYPFPSGARAVASRFSDEDALYLPPEYVELDASETKKGA